ncbi:MAG: hypothetical protein JWP12_2012 [Bacteroidetes bacterium]|nr:hypothetical protein [Bacteroidota bacterium]
MGVKLSVKTRTSWDCFSAWADRNGVLHVGMLQISF